MVPHSCFHGEVKQILRIDVFYSKFEALRHARRKLAMQWSAAKKTAARRSWPVLLTTSHEVFCSLLMCCSFLRCRSSHRQLSSRMSKSLQFWIKNSKSKHLFTFTMKTTMELSCFFSGHNETVTQFPTQRDDLFTEEQHENNKESTACQIVRSLMIKPYR